MSAGRRPRRCRIMCARAARSFWFPTPDAGASIAKSAAGLARRQSRRPAHGRQDAGAGGAAAAGDPSGTICSIPTAGRKLGVLRAFQYRPVKTGADWQTLIASAKGAPLLARRTFERGPIFASGLAFTPKWSSLPLKAGFVVLMQNAVFGDAGRASAGAADERRRGFSF